VEASALVLGKYNEESRVHRLLKNVKVALSETNNSSIAQKFVEEGAKVLITDIKEDHATDVSKKLGCEYILADVTKREDWEAVLKKVLDTYGQLDIVVNNAGTTYHNKPTETVTDQEYDMVMNVNVKSIFLSTSVTLQYFLEKSHPGVFINIASTAGIRPRPGLAWYNASKAAVNNATKSMAVEYGPKGIRFVSICPVLAASTKLTHLFIGKEDTEENRKAFVSTVPLGRTTKPSDVANACCYLASDEASFVTGVEFPVDGGRCI